MDKMRVVLVNAPPLAVLEKWHDEPPYGRTALTYLAGYLREYPQFEITLIDAKFQKMGFEETIARIKELDPHLVGFTAFTNEIKPCAYVAARVKELLPNVVTVVGGAHVTAIPQATLNEFRSFDLVAVGEGEQTLYELCEALRLGEDVTKVDGLAYRVGNRSLLSNPRERILDQDSIPWPAWDMLPPAQNYWIQTERGCPFNCHFCVNHNGRVARKRSVENVLGELAMIIEKFKPEIIRFGDELFSIDMERSKNILREIIDRSLNKSVRYDCQTHVRFVDYDLLKLMKEANFEQVDMGVETGDEQQLRKLGKGTTREQILAAGRAARKARMPFGTFIIVGQPNETRESIRQNISLAVELNPNYPIVGVMCPYPGTEVSRMAANHQEGLRLLTTDWDEYNKQIGGVMEFENFTREQIEWCRLMIYLKVYVYNYRFLDLLKLFWRFRSGAMVAIRNVLFGAKTLRQRVNTPPGYDEILARGKGISAEEIALAREDWQNYQKREMMRTRQIDPNLLRVVTVSNHSMK